MRSARRGIERDFASGQLVSQGLSIQRRVAAAEQHQKS
jgi:hypothetical protein